MSSSEAPGSAGHENANSQLAVLPAGIHSVGAWYRVPSSIWLHALPSAVAVWISPAGSNPPFVLLGAPLVNVILADQLVPSGTTPVAFTLGWMRTGAPTWSFPPAFVMKGSPPISWTFVLGDAVVEADDSEFDGVIVADGSADFPQALTDITRIVAPTISERMAEQ